MYRDFTYIDDVVEIIFRLIKVNSNKESRFDKIILIQLQVGHH